MNRLKDATSPYLLQHADNPVDWWPWARRGVRGGAAPRRAVLLSVGYAACHWCHVMAHESFEDAATAAADERALRQHQGRPRGAARRRRRLHGGHPGDDRAGRLADDRVPHARRASRSTAAPTSRPQPRHRHAVLPAACCAAVSASLEEQRDEVERRRRRRHAAAGRAQLAVRAAREPPGRASSTRRLSRAARRTSTARTAGSAARRSSRRPWCWSSCCATTRAPATTSALEMVADTLRGDGPRRHVRPARRRLRPVLGRRRWVVPHFEKMLYDNALLLRVYAHCWRATRRRVRPADRAGDRRLDAARPAHGRRRLRLRARRRQRRARRAASTCGRRRSCARSSARTTAPGPPAFGVTDGGHLRARDLGAAARHADPADQAAVCADRERAAGRPRGPGSRPARDDKVVAAWNGLAIAALAEAGALFDRPDCVEAAVAAADLLGTSQAGAASGPRAGLARTSHAAGTPGANAGVLEDYADVAEGFLALYAVTGEDGG